MGQMTETQNVATYSRIRPYNPAINEAKELTCRAEGDNKILNQNGSRVDSYNFTKVYGASSSTNDLFETAMGPLMDHKILKGITSIFIVYGQSGSGKSFTLIGEPGHLGLFPMSLQYLLDQESVQKIDIMAIECYGIKAAKIGFYDLVNQLKEKEKNPKKYDAYACKDNNRLNTKNAQMINVTKENCLKLITNLQEVSHMAPTLKNPHSSRGHTCYFTRIKLKGLEDVYLINIDLAGSEGQTALGTKDEFTSGLKLAMSKGKLHLSKKQQKGIEEMYKTRSLEAGCINNGLTQLQSIFGELIKKKISKSQGLGLRKVLSSFISLKSAYAILFTLSASANNNKVTRATLNFAKQTQLVKVETVKAKVKIDKDAIIRELKDLIETLKEEIGEKNSVITDLNKTINDLKNNQPQSDEHKQNDADNRRSVQFDIADSDDELDDDKDLLLKSVTDRMQSIKQAMKEEQEEEAKWTLNLNPTQNINSDDAPNKPPSLHRKKTTMMILDNLTNPNMDEDEMKKTFDAFDEDGGGTIDAFELQKAMKRIGRDMEMEEIEKLIKVVDKDGDGVLDFEEFQVMVGQSWFIDAFQNTLIQKMESYMALSMHFDEEDDIKTDDDDEEDEEQGLDEDKEQELISEINEQSQKIQTLEIEVKDAVFKNDEYENEIEKLKALLKKREKQMQKLDEDKE